VIARWDTAVPTNYPPAGLLSPLNLALHSAGAHGSILCIDWCSQTRRASRGGANFALAQNVRFTAACAGSFPSSFYSRTNEAGLNLNIGYLLVKNRACRAPIVTSRALLQHGDHGDHGDHHDEDHGMALKTSGCFLHRPSLTASRMQ